METAVPFMEVLKAISTYGLAVVLVLLGFVFVGKAVWKLVNRLMDESAKRDERLFAEASKRDQRIAEILDGSLKSLTATIDNMCKVILAHETRENNFFEQTQSIYKFQREEHEKIMEQGTKQIEILTELSALIKAQT